MINFEEALDKTLAAPYYLFTNGLPQKQFIHLSKEEKIKIIWLNDEIRNNFIHFIPGIDVISINELKSVCIIAMNLIEILAVKSFSINLLDFENSQNKISVAIERLRRNLIE